MTPYVSLCGCHGNQGNTNRIFHINFSMIEMFLFIISAGVLFKVVLNEGEDHKKTF